MDDPRQNNQTMDYETSLREELKKLKSTLSLRPNTTGVLFSSAKSNATRSSPLVDLQPQSATAAQAPFVRPRAPLSRHVDNSNSYTPSAESKSKLWDSISDFARSDTARLSSAEGQQVQFLNLEDDEATPTSTNATSSFSKSFTNGSGSSSSSSSSTRGGNSSGKSASSSSSSLSHDALFTKKEPKQKVLAASQGQFFIPDMPRGKTLVFSIHSTWGDRHYVGLQGIETFDENGRPARVSKISSSPVSITSAQGVSNLIDGVNQSCDDAHAWLCPFTAGQSHQVTIEFAQPVTLSLIRCWNYNRSRIHSERGARYVEITLDNVVIFKGEVRKASGSVNVSNFDEESESILFTTNRQILAMLERNDLAAQASLAAQRLEEEISNVLAHSKGPLVADESDFTPEFLPGDALGRDLPKASSSSSSSSPSSLARPRTGKQRMPEEGLRIYELLREEGALSRSMSTQSLRPSTAAGARKQCAVCGSILEMVLLSNWGDPELLGLTGIKLMDANLNEIDLPVPQLYLGRVDDERLVRSGDVDTASVSPASAIVDGENTTTDSRHMWISRFPPRGLSIVLRWDLRANVELKGLRIWNFNAGREGAVCGIKHVNIFLDGRQMSSGSVVRKAPGDNLLFDWAQFLPVQEPSAATRVGNKLFNLASSSSSFRASSSFTTSPPAKLTVPQRTEKPSDVWVASPSDSSDVNEESSEPSSSMMDDGPSSSSSSHLHYYSSSSSACCLVPQQYETPVHPCGCMIKFVMHSTHGDVNYVGLNGLALFNAQGDKIEIDMDQVQAIPYRDVNDLQHIRQKGHDARSLDNLFNGSPSDTFNDRYMWLCPLSDANAPNQVLILMDEPVTISLIKIWNYSKTPTRGVKDLEVFIDDVLVFRGSLAMSPALEDLPVGTSSSGPSNSSGDAKLMKQVKHVSYQEPGEEGAIDWGTKDKMDLSQAILFTNEQRIVRREEARVPQFADEIVFFDEGVVVAQINSSNARPMTAVSGY